MSKKLTGRDIDKPKTILVAPLSWGLGHATRCIPIIKGLLAQNTRVILAGDGAVAALLSKEFPSLTLLALKNFTIKYGSGQKGFMWKMLWQLPPAILSVYREKRWLAKMIRDYQIDAVISDNRMGLSNKKIPSVYITHQLCIKTGMGKWADKIAQCLHYHFINKFTECWVPDFEEEKINLAGELSHPQKKPAVPVKYMGALSRFEKLPQASTLYDHLIILSGPEPQRTIFENILLKQIPLIDGKFLLVRGLPGSNKTIAVSANTTVVNHLASDELNKVIQSSSLIISRSGYTTVMDLIKLSKKAILVPTPGQTEQEYLAQHLKQNNLFYTAQQEKFDLKKAVEDANKISSATNDVSMDLYKPFIKHFVLSVSKQ